MCPCVPYVISGGHDCLVRCWDIENSKNCCVIGQDSFLESNFVEYNYPDLKVIQDNPYQSLSISYSSRATKRKEYSDTPNHRKSSHTDTILDIDFLSYGKNLLLTASRDGTIKAWS